MTRIATLAVLLGCGSGNKTDTADTSVESDADTDTDTDADADADADSDADPTSHVRIIHVSPGLGDMDMIVNNTPPPSMVALAFEDGTPWTHRPFGTHNFKFVPTGGDVGEAIVDFDDTIVVDTFHTFAIFDVAPNVQVMRFVDDPNGVFPGQIRLRWTHAAIGLGQLDVVQINGDIAHATDLEFGRTGVDDYDAGPMTIGIDATDDGVPEWIFADFDLDPNTMVDLWIVNDCDGCTPFLLAHQPNGNTPRRDVAIADTAGDTGT